ncbi:MAG: N-acetylglucosaminidase [Candidatus Saccharibacteria bacterium]
MTEKIQATTEHLRAMSKSLKNLYALLNNIDNELSQRLHSMPLEGQVRFQVDNLWNIEHRRAMAMREHANKLIKLLDQTAHDFEVADGKGAQFRVGTNSYEKGPDGVTETNLEFEQQLKKFPVSYRAKLLELHKLHPNWRFEAMQSPVSWDELIELEDKYDTNLIEITNPPSYREPDPNNRDGWSPPTRQVIEHYADPRSFFDEKGIYQFLNLGYNADTANIDTVNSILKGSVFANQGETIMRAGKESGVSPDYLAIKLIAESGSKGNPLSSGTVKGHEGLYNPYNFNAAGESDTEVLSRGAAKAQREGWDSLEKGIIGGAQILAEDYISKGQDTIYGQKFDLIGPAQHQYMQNIKVADLEGKHLAKHCMEQGSDKSALVFKIPVFRDLPDNPTRLPDEKDR